jgi:tetrahydromethanopterin:alpha-L-glutamate ligase
MTSRPPFRVGVLGSATGWYLRDLQRAAADRPVESPISVESLSFATLSVHNRPSTFTKQSPNAHPIRVASTRDAIEPTTFSGTQPNPIAVALDEYDALLVRTMPLGSLEQTIFRMNALHAAQNSGVIVLNAPRCLEIAIDKWLTLDVAQRAGILTPATVCCQSREEAMAAFESLGNDCVVKPIFGGEGRGILRVTDSDMAWRVFSTLEQLHAVIYLQEFLPSVGYDLRLLILGDQVYSVRRENKGDWRSNVARGGTAVPYEPTFEQVDMAFRASRAIGGWMVGIDILPTQDGRDILIEANAVPGWRATANALGVDIAGQVLKELSEHG